MLASAIRRYVVNLLVAVPWIDCKGEDSLLSSAFGYVVHSDTLQLESAILSLVEENIDFWCISLSSRNV